MKLENKIAAVADAHQSVYTEDEMEVIERAYRCGSTVNDAAEYILGDTGGKDRDGSDEYILCMVDVMRGGVSVFNVGGGSNIIAGRGFNMNGVGGCTLLNGGAGSPENGGAGALVNGDGAI